MTPSTTDGEETLDQLTNKVDRFEVIDHTGRAYTTGTTPISIKLDYQDDGRTLKVFLTNKQGEN